MLKPLTHYPPSHHPTPNPPPPQMQHFTDPDDKSYPRFKLVKDKVMTLFSSENQLSTGKTEVMTIGQAVKIGLVDNETLGFFLARTQEFCERIGMDPSRVRFRQHLKTEMAHYACDCWDLEIKSSYGWTECAGHADRSAYDLTVHSKATKTELVATKHLEKPIDVEIAKVKHNRKELGAVFKGDQRKVANAIDALAENWSDFEPWVTKLEAEGKNTIEGFEVTKSMFTYERKTKKVQERKFTPSVIEPSFGIGRILYSLLEHSFDVRKDDEQRTFLKFKPAIAPVKCIVLPLQKDKCFQPIVEGIKSDLMSRNLAAKVDNSTASLGKRYSRADEIGIPFAVTVDFESVSVNTVTLRDRDSMEQIRADIGSIVQLVEDICKEKTTFEEAQKKLGGLGANKSVTVENTGRGMFSRPAPKE